jgi:hypothetical protein
MKVVIVAKTKMSHGVCVGGFDMEAHKNVRLIPLGEYNNPADTEFNIGGVWDIEYQQKADITPPHVEDVIFTKASYRGKMIDLGAYIKNFCEIDEGPPHVLFDGKLRATSKGSGYVCQAGGFPSHSVGFWITDRDLTRKIIDDKVRYYYPANAGVQKIAFTGVADSIPIIKEGTLIRVSLARPWIPEEKPDFEERCYLQLSGWYE